MHSQLSRLKWRDGGIEIFKRSVPQYVMYTEYLGDGDINAYKSVCDAQPYGPDIVINKLECVGHVQKRMGTRLRNLKAQKKKVKPSDGKPLAGKGRLTNLAIQRIQTFYGLAIRRNANQLDKMREDVWATFYHLLSTNSNPRHIGCAHRTLKFGVHTLKVKKKKKIMITPNTFICQKWL